MADTITYELKGTKEILDALDALSSKELLSIIKSVERKALVENIVTPLRSAIPDSPTTKKSIRIVSDRSDRTALFAGPTSDAYWLRFVEKGTDIRTTKKGANRGQIVPRGIIIPLIEDKVDAIINYFTVDFGSAVESVLNKKLKKLKK